MRPNIWTAGALALLAVGCSGKQLASRYVVSQHVTAASGAAISVDANREPALAGTTLVIPPGALAQDTTITLELGEAPILTQRGDFAAGPVAIWGPSGTQFNQPISMTLPFRLSSNHAPQDLYVQVVEDDGTPSYVLPHSHLSINSVSGLVTFNVKGFTSFQPGAGQQACRTDSDCAAAGEVCNNGVCDPPDDGGVCGNDCRNTNCAPPLGICPAGDQISCDPTSGQWVCSGTFDGGQFCSSNADCPAGDTCINGVCEPANTFQCRTDQDCQAGEVCVFFTAGGDGGSITTGSACMPGGQDGGPFDAGPGPDGGVCNNDCRITNCGPPPGLCSAGGGVPACDPTNGAWFCSQDGGSGACGPDICGACPAGCTAVDTCDPQTDRWMCSCACGGPIDGGQQDAGPFDAGPAPDAGQFCRTDTDCQFPQHCINFVCQ